MIASTVAAVLLGTAGVGVASLARGDKPIEADCPTSQSLDVAAAPEVATAVRDLARSTSALRCVRVQVSSSDPAEVAAALRAGHRRVDVWVPDSSVWSAALPRGLDAAAMTQRSIARSPVVLALSARTADRLGTADFTSIARAATTAQSVVLRAGSPRQSATAQAALLELNASVGRSPAGRGYLAAMLRSMDTSPASAELPHTPARDDGLATATATTERAVWAANQVGDRPTYRAVYASVPGLAMDYPYLVLATEPAVTRDANALWDALTGARGRAALARLGFRAADGGRNPLLTSATGVDASAGTAASALTPSSSRAALATLDLLDRPSRVLALVDVSGSMAQPVPGAAGTTRMALVRRAIGASLHLFPSQSVAGLWRFSSGLTPTTDYRAVTPLRPLTRHNRAALAGAVRGLAVDPHGGTGLYGSVLAAVRNVRASYDPARINSVVVLSDGKDQYGEHDISLEALLAALQSENDRSRPVVVISIAYGPESDSAAMRAISMATGGALYQAKDPRDLPVIFREAIGHRLCRSGC